MAQARIDLDPHPLFWRTAGLVFVLSLLYDWTSRPRRMRPLRRVLFSLYSLPKSLIVGFLASAIVTILACLVFRAVIRPIIERWHAPAGDDSPVGFHLASNEWVIRSCPARQAAGWMWRAGTLVRTNLALWFFPRWSNTVWACPLERVSEIQLEPAPQVAWGLIRDWPERIAVRSLTGDLERFAVVEPRSVLAWLKTVTCARKHEAVRS